MKTKKFLLDSLLNIISAALPLFVLQLVSFPLIARELGGEEYGVIVTIVSLFTVISFPIGNVLNNVRLLKDKDYKISKVNGDFNLILVGSSLLSVILIIIISVYVDHTINLWNLLFISLITICSLWKEYLVVSFRLVLNYKGILLNNLYMSLGYIIGSLLFYFIGYWQIIYLIGLLFSLIYIFRHTELHKEPYKITALFKETVSKGSILYIASLLKNLLGYIDKLLLLPLLGPSSVAIYYTSTILGKIISMMITPINSVILSYLVNVESIRIRNVLKILGVASIVGFLGYIMTIFLSPFFFDFFYREWAEQSLELIKITTATAILSVISTVLQPFNLRFNKLSWQIYMGVLHLIVYVAAAYYFYTRSGLIGFCFGILLSAVFKLCMQLFIFLLSYKRIDKSYSNS